MFEMNKKEIDRHIKTHSLVSALDRAAVNTLSNFLESKGKINELFSAMDKRPNIDGTFELVLDPMESRRPAQSFCVQIKGTHDYKELSDGGIKYSLKSLAFPAYICQEVSLDPGILFVVLNPDVRGGKRVFWKYMSLAFISTIDFKKDSRTIEFSAEEEIFDTDESVDNFCKELEKIVKYHSFSQKIVTLEYDEHNIHQMIKFYDTQIVEILDRLQYGETRDFVSKKILMNLNQLCVATSLLFAIKHFHEPVNLRLAWEQSLLDRNTKYLGDFYRMLQYRGYRIPDDGQAERLMLKYYNFMWQIRKDLYGLFNISVLKNLEMFPLKLGDKNSDEYYASVAKVVDKFPFGINSLRNTRYYIQKKTPFFVGKERYYEVTLQLAGLYATKYNRITIYTKENISTNYSIQIGYEEDCIELWGVKTQIKIVTDWKVSIYPTVLNKLAKALYIDTQISSVYGEYMLIRYNLQLIRYSVNAD